MSKQECTNRVTSKINQREKKMRLCRLFSLIGAFLIFSTVNIFLVIIVFSFYNLIAITTVIGLFLVGIIMRKIANKVLDNINEGLIIK